MINKLAELSDTKKIALSVILIATVAIIIYSNSFYASFHFDDHPTIVENYTIHRFDLKEIFSTSSRPILDLTFALNYYFGKLDVFGYHLVNIMLHIANGIMLYFILLWTINTPHPNPPPQGGRAGEGVFSAVNFRVPLYASLIFIAHPIQTQAVTYIVSRSSVLATTFYLISVLLFIRAFKQIAKREEQKTNDERLYAPGSMPYALSSKLYYFGAFLSSCLGMGTKQETATLPLMLLIYDFYFISKGDWKVLKGHYKIHLIMFSTVLIAVYLSFSGLKMFVSFDYAKGVPMPQEVPITSFQYFLTQLHVIPYYIRLLFVPANLNLDYDWPITRNIDLPTILFFVLLTCIIVAAIMLYRRAQLISFGIIWFFVTLSVTSSFIVIYDVIFEHRLYLPSIGFAMVIAFMISKISNLKIGGKVNWSN
ncbi:MAG: hypothetical protein A2Z50_00270 [Nitrospirae bacterium RBG_19FT_COMBO_42_15]|nr:MAG: hypothetical protein A2Z50_00270 [Nitrospirae bacterium RBG_19FT_COMBO_42_15]